jgi:hypothetical protein
MLKKSQCNVKIKDGIFTHMKHVDIQEYIIMMYLDPN